LRFSWIRSPVQETAMRFVCTDTPNKTLNDSKRAADREPFNSSHKNGKIHASVQTSPQRNSRLIDVATIDERMNKETTPLALH
jgi:hypothetical protein